MKTQPFSRKKKQLRQIALELHQAIMLEKGNISPKIEQLILQIRRLTRELMNVFSQAELKKVLGATALFVGLGVTTTQAQVAFTGPITHPFGLDTVNGVAIPTFADLDGDGDFDMLVGSYYGVLQYHENIGQDTAPNFAPGIINPFGLVSTYYLAFPAFVDLDGDGDFDLMVGEYYGHFQFFENTGTATAPAFAAPLKNPFNLTPNYGWASPTFGDLDGDGDLDLLAGEYYGNMNYFENTGTATSPSFAAPQKLPFGIDSTYLFAFPALGDIDLDGDLDLLVGEYYGDFKFFENQGSVTAPQFGPSSTNPFNLHVVSQISFPAFVDLDADGDLDLMVGDYDSLGFLNYWENQLPIPISRAPQIARLPLKIFPNPCTDFLGLQSSEAISEVEIMDIQGRTLLKLDSPEEKIDLRNLPAGPYLLRATGRNKEISIQKLVKK
ncbi:MAG: T9SS type A sorting domain-containing protein [Bacteroidia bacterium]|nr:T9SS type A sorting domain-containing protein [Bacteroidia bacterium]